MLEILQEELQAVIIAERIATLNLVSDIIPADHFDEYMQLIKSGKEVYLYEVPTARIINVMNQGVRTAYLLPHYRFIHAMYLYSEDGSQVQGVGRICVRDTITRMRLNFDLKVQPVDNEQYLTTLSRKARSYIQHHNIYNLEISGNIVAE